MADTPDRQHAYRYPRPSLTVDVVLATIREKALHLLLIQRRQEPYQGQWALPGGFVEEMESLEHAAARELEEETGVRGITLRQCGAFGAPGRDPRGWTVSVAFAGLIPEDRIQLQAMDDAAAVNWFPMTGLPPLAFDHSQIIAAGLQTLRRDTLHLLQASAWFPEPFTWRELHHVYQIIQDQNVDGPPLRRRWVKEGKLVKVQGKKVSKRGKKPALWRFPIAEDT